MRAFTRTSQNEARFFTIARERVSML